LDVGDVSNYAAPGVVALTISDTRSLAYRIPLRLVPGFAIDLVLGRRRSFSRDARRVLDANPYARRVEGLEHVPESGSFVLVMNHYSESGLRPYHCAMAISDALARRPGQAEVCWAFTSEFVDQRVGPVPIPVWLFRWVFRRAALVYGLVVLPRRAGLVRERAAALRALIRGLERGPVGLAPEGLEGEGAIALVDPPEGVGLLLTTLTRGGAPLLPVASWPDGPTLAVRFGEPFRIAQPPGERRDEQDRHARDQVMVAIGRLLPRANWGAFAHAIAAATGESIDS
jgi:1-acyl-sn-glycerol-3-phosphate acyltransferase